MKCERVDSRKIAGAAAAGDGEAADKVPWGWQKTPKEGDLLQNHFFMLMKRGTFLLLLLMDAIFYVHFKRREKCAQI